MEARARGRVVDFAFGACFGFRRESNLLGEPSPSATQILQKFRGRHARVPTNKKNITPSIVNETFPTVRGGLAAKH